ncbi:MAG TPA: phage portal protein [Vicinamibacterales bacterium]|nr:phage portal protein [Vicinamibacterales bacterium]
MPELSDLGPQLSKLLVELDKRTARCKRNSLYLDATNECAIPDAIVSARMTKAYKLLMPMAGAPWASVAVDSVLDRLEVGGIRTGDKDTDRAIWRSVWQANALDSESKLGHQGILTNGRAFAIIWPDAEGQPEVVLQGADQVIVQYQEGRHQPRHRIAALRRWVDDGDRQHVTLYTSTALYKLSEAKEQTDKDGRVKAGGKWWEPREETGYDGLPEPWPLENPFGVVPVVELATNRRLGAGAFPYARGEYEHCIGLLDRIDLLTFLGLVVALWMGFPLRGVVGDKIIRDDDNNPLPPFSSKPDEIIQFEKPDAKLVEFQAADRGNLSIFGELAQFAYVTKSPAHYFPMDRGGIANINADTIRALEGGLHAKVDGIHKPFIGEGWEEITRVGGLMLPDSIEVPREAAVYWIDRQTRSLAEAADASIKLKDILPPLFIAEKFLNLTQEEIGRIDAEGAGAAFNRLLEEAANTPTPELVPEPVA